MKNKSTRREIVVAAYAQDWCAWRDAILGSVFGSADFLNNTWRAAQCDGTIVQFFFSDLAVFYVIPHVTLFTWSYNFKIADKKKRKNWTHSSHSLIYGSTARWRAHKNTRKTLYSTYMSWTMHETLKMKLKQLNMSQCADFELCNLHVQCSMYN